MSRRRERGVALVAATIALALVSALATGLAYTTTVDQRLVRNALASAQADALARSGVAAAAVLLRETSRGDAPDTLRAPWALPSGRQVLGAGWVEVRIEDEARRLGLDAPAPEMERLLGVAGLDPRLAAALGDWSDPDDATRADGAESDWYGRLPVPRRPRNAPPRSVAELALVRGFDAPAVARLRPWVSAAGEHGVNPNTAPREVLLALSGDAAAVARVLAARAERPLDADALATLLPHVPPARMATRSDAWHVRVTAGVGETRRRVEATLWMPAGTGRAAEVVAWEPVPDAGTD